MRKALDPDSCHEFPIVLAAMPASSRQRKIAYGALIVLAVVVATTVPFVNTRLARVDAFVPIVQTITCVADLFTAVLLFAQYAVYPQRALLALASGFLFSGLFAFLQTLAFPGAYGPGVLIGDELNSAAWLYMLWHTTFPAAVIVYTLWKDQRTAANPFSPSTGVTIGVTVACVALATAGLTWIVTEFVGYLPNLYVNAIQRTFFSVDEQLFLALLSAAALLLLFFRKRTILDYWLIVTLLAWLPNFVVASLFATFFRFSLSWYIARIYALCAGCGLLFALVAEALTLYARLAAATSALKESNQSLEESNQSLEQVNLWLSTALKNMTHALSMFDKDQRLILCNARYHETYGLTPEQTKPGTSLRSILSTGLLFRDSGIEIDIEEQMRAIRNSQPTYNEYELRDGRIIAMNLQPMPDGGWVAIHQDITGRKHAEEHQRLLIAELDHRVKNILARVAQVANYTRQGSGSMEQFVQALDGRIQSMADAHSLLSRNRWRGVGLVDLVRRQLAPYSTETNVAIGGPDITLSAEATQALAMVLQELVTNAVKYGALSHPHGLVSVCWEHRLDHDVAERLAIAWRETGGPPPETPSKSSYGTNLIRGLIPRELGGAVDLTFPSEGVRCNIEIPIRSTNANVTVPEEHPMAIVTPNRA